MAALLCSGVAACSGKDGEPSGGGPSCEGEEVPNDQCNAGCVELDPDCEENACFGAYGDGPCDAHCPGDPDCNGKTECVADGTCHPPCNAEDPDCAADICALQERYGDGPCDAECPLDDPDCVPSTGNSFIVTGVVTGLDRSQPPILQLNGGETVVGYTEDGEFGFDETPLATGDTYEVTVYSEGATNPCWVSNGSGIVGTTNVHVVVTCYPGYTVGGTVSGLSGSVTLQLNGSHDLTLDANGPYRFEFATDQDYTYRVTLGLQPAGQVCTVSNATGVLVDDYRNIFGDVTNMNVACVDVPAGQFTVGGTLAGGGGLAGLLGLVELDLEYGAEAPPHAANQHHCQFFANGDFLFSQSVANGQNYAVTVRTKPSSPSQTCTGTASTTGSVSGSNISNIGFACETDPFVVGGRVSGLASGQTLTLSEGGRALQVTEDGPFSFAAMEDGYDFRVEIASTGSVPAGTRCGVAHGRGSLRGYDVDFVEVSCLRVVSATALPANRFYLAPRPFALGTLVEPILVEPELTWTTKVSVMMNGAIGVMLTGPSAVVDSSGRTVLDAGTDNSPGAGWAIMEGLFETPVLQTLQIDASAFDPVAVPAVARTGTYRGTQMRMISVEPESFDRLVVDFSAEQYIGNRNIEKFSLRGPGDAFVLGSDWGTVVLSVFMEELGAYTLLASGVTNNAGLEALPPFNSVLFQGFAVQVTGAGGSTHNGLNVTFNVPVDQTTAEDPANYTIPGNTVVSAVLAASGKSVTLTTEKTLTRCSEPSSGFSHRRCNWVEVANVRDAQRALTVNAGRNGAYFDNSAGIGVRSAVMSGSTLTVRFWDPVLEITDDTDPKWPTSAVNPANYSVEGFNSPAVVSASICGSDPACVNLGLSTSLSTWQVYRVAVSDVEISDQAGPEHVGLLIDNSTRPLVFTGQPTFRLGSIGWEDPELYGNKDTLRLWFTQAVQDNGAAEDPCNYASEILTSAGYDIASNTTIGFDPVSDAQVVTIVFDVPLPDAIRQLDFTVQTRNGCPTIMSASGGGTMFDGRSNRLLVEFSNALDHWRPDSEGSATLDGNYVFENAPDLFVGSVLHLPEPTHVLLYVNQPALYDGTYSLEVRNLRDHAQALILPDSTVSFSVP